MKKNVVFLSLLLALPLNAAHASVVNGGFEDGLSGWNMLIGTNPTKVNVLSTINNFQNIPYNPTEGSKFLDLTTGLPWTVLYQEFEVAQASIVSFDWAFLKGNEHPSFTSGYAGVWIGDTSNFSAPSILSFANQFHDIGWQTFTQSIGVGTSVIAFLSNKAPSENSGQFLVDHVQVTAVPEPRISTLMLAGILGLFAFSFYREKAKKTLNLVVN